MIALQPLQPELLGWLAAAMAVVLGLGLRAALPPPEAETQDAVLAALGAL